MKNIFRFFLVLGIGLAALPAWGWERGTTGADYLKIGLGADAVGMGEAYTAHQGDVTSMFYNPAGLATMDSNQLAATHLNWIADMQYEALAYARPNVEFGTVGASVFLLHMPPIPARDELNNDLGTLNVSDLGVQFSYAKDMNRWLGVSGLSGGASLKILHRELAGQTASGGALDLGALYNWTDNFSIGAALLNAGYLSKFGSEQDYLPLMLRLGAAFTQEFAAGQKLIAALDLTQTLDSPIKANLGLDYALARIVHIRAGYKFGYDNDGFQAGLGVGWQNLSVDYAAKIMGVFGLTHYVSASFGFGKKIVEQQQDRGQ
jgi:long-subunit fatty acid transport protein